MTYAFGEQSRKRLDTCHPLLIQLCELVIQEVDFTVVCGHRDREAQERALREGFSKAAFGESPHNCRPSLAIDVAPYPIDWKDTHRFAYVAGVFRARARDLGIPLRWGADWDRDTLVSEHSFLDFPHFELHPWRDFMRAPHGVL